MGTLHALPAAAQDADIYISGSIGANFQNDSSNSGDFSRDFTIAGTALDGTTLAEGTAVGWETEFDTGFAGSVAAGLDFGVFRVEAEIARQGADVDTHAGVVAGGVALDDVDATVLLEGTATDQGATVGELVAAGEGDISATYFMVNAIYDIELDSRVTPYVGAGLGFAEVDVEFAPSGLGILDEGETMFAYQAMLGASVELAPQLTGFSEIAYRATDDVELDLDLFPAELEIENESVLLEFGLRYDFAR